MLDNANTKYVAMFTRDVAIAATDGSNLLLNPDTFFKYNLSERIFICCHEIMHCILNHCVLMHGFHRRGKVSYPDGSSLPYDQKTMNVAADYVINDMLIESKVGLFNKDWLHDPSIAVAKDSVIDAYKKLFKQNKGKGPKAKKPGDQPCDGGDGGDGPPTKGKGFDEHLKPGTSQGKDAQDAANDRNDVEWTTQIAAAVNSARLQGKLPAGLDRLLGEILEPKVDWKDKIAAIFARKVGSGSNDWRRPDRRLIVRDIYAPGRSGFGAGTVVIGIDTSGSIREQELNMFFAEMAGILEDVRPKRMVVMWCDAKVHRVDEVEEAADLNHLRKQGIPGGGGTNFCPVFDEMKAMGLDDVDALVYLTDGYGTFPKASPEYAVVWGSITPPDSVKYPFGDVVDIPMQA
jgi:predicted metal-dependent peptidase